MEWWNGGRLVFKRILAILILSSILPMAGPLIQPCIILSEPEARTHYSIVPSFPPGRRRYPTGRRPIVSEANYLKLVQNMFHQMAQLRENQFLTGQLACIDAARHAKYNGFFNDTGSRS